MKAENRSFYRSLASLVIPITIQNFITNAVNSADVLMLGYVGQTELSAVSLANQFQFLLSGFFFGISSGVVMLASQYWGKKDTDSIQAVMGIATKIAFVTTLILALGAVFMPHSLMRIYTDDGTLVGIGASYLRIVGVSYVCMSFSQVYHCTLRSMERAQLSTVISSVALVLNVVLNAVFIFGLGGAPRLGVVGVAIGTTAARVTELALCLLDAVRGKLFAIDLKIMFGRHKLLFADFCKYSLPAMINDFSWTFAFSMYSVIMGHMNADVVAASSVATAICVRFCALLWVPGPRCCLALRLERGKFKKQKRMRENPVR